MSRLAASIIIVSVLVGLGLSAPGYLDSNHTATGKKEFRAKAKVINTSGNETKSIGIVGDPRLDFGVLPYEAGSAKFIDLKAGRKSLITLSATGNISEFLEYRRKAYFEGDKQIKIHFDANETGFFAGNVSVGMQTPVDRWGRLWLDVKSSIY